MGAAAGSPPEESQALATGLAERGAELRELPVLGSEPEAFAGTLQLMAGGTPEALHRTRPVLLDLGGEPHHLRPVGAALTTKLALNQLIASLSLSFSLHLVQRAGVDGEVFMAILRASALCAPTFDRKLAKELADDHATPKFPTAHLRKDLRLFLQAAAGAGLNTEGLPRLDSLDCTSLHRLTAPRAPPTAPVRAGRPASAQGLGLG